MVTYVTLLLNILRLLNAQFVIKESNLKCFLQKAISSDFEMIYQQAYWAENEGLDQISGIGYRRALEFLVKDYCKIKNPSDKVEIENMSLAQCIKNYIDYPKLKTVTERAAWLGNDQAHYIQKQTETWKT
jgi:hypothetical protein